MANRYVYHGGSNTSPYDTWVKAATTLTTAITGAVAGDVFYVAHDHAESTAGAVTLTFPGTFANPNLVLCVNRAGTVPPVAADLMTGAVVQTTGANGLTVNPASGGANYVYGIRFAAGSAANAAALTIGGNVGQHWVFEQCELALTNTSATSQIAFGPATASNGATITLINTDLEFGATTQDIFVRCPTFWRGGAVAGSAATPLFGASLSMAAINAVGVDLSVVGSGSVLVGANASSGRYVFNHCKLGSSVTVANAPTGAAFGVDLIRCDSGDTNYRNERYRYQGTLTTETTIVRTGGASDGTTPFSWKIVTTANAEWTAPFDALPISIWNETTGSAITLTIEGIWDAGAVPNDEDIWLEVEYLGTPGFPISSFANDSKATILTTTAAQTSSSETWTTTGLATPVKFKLAVMVTPQEKGPITLVVKAAKISSTFYIDPKVTVT